MSELMGDGLFGLDYSQLGGKAYVNSRKERTLFYTNFLHFIM